MYITNFILKETKMKSFCVLNSAVTPAVAQNIGAAVAEVLGGKLGVLYCGSEASVITAHNIAKGIKKQGGCAVLSSDAFEAQTAFACRHYSLDGAFFVNGENKCSISVYGGNAANLTCTQEDEISALVAKDKLGGHRGGTAIHTDLNSVYYKHLLEAAQSFEGIAVSIKSENLLIKNQLVRALLALGGESKGRVTFFISPSGFCLSAVDEYGRIHTRDELISVLYALKITREKLALELSFSLSECLDALAKESGVEIRRSFTGGNELFTKDSVFLASGILKNMSQIGCGLSELCSVLPETTVSRKTFTSSQDILKIADEMECEQLVTDGNSVFAKVRGSNVLVTPNGTRGRYCLEVQAADSETARELALNLTDIYI